MRSGVGVLDKVVAIVDAVAEQPCDLARLQEVTALPRATAHRLATSLVAQGWLRRDDRGRFCLGFELLRLGERAAESFPLAELAAPALRALCDETGESVQLFVRDASGRRCVASLQSRHALQWLVPVGALLPLEVGSAGKVLAGPGSPALADSVEEREPGVASVSAAVIDAAGSTIAAVSVSGPIERLGRSPVARWGEATRRAAAVISTALR